MRRLQIKCHLQNISENENQSLGTPCLIAPSDYSLTLLQKQLCSTSQLKCTKLSAERLLNDSHRSLNLVQLTRGTKCMVVRQSGQ